MTSLLSPFTDLPDAQLFDEVRTLSHRERHAIAQLIACLAEIDARRLYREEGCSSLFTYCRRCCIFLNTRPTAASKPRAPLRRFPIVLERLADGSITLTTVCLPRRI